MYIVKRKENPIIKNNNLAKIIQQVNSEMPILMMNCLHPKAFAELTMTFYRDVILSNLAAIDNNYPITLTLTNIFLNW